MTAIPDVHAENHGTIWLLRGDTPAGQEWLDANVAFEHFFARAGVVEHRYVQDILQGAAEAGLELEVTP